MQKEIAGFEQVGSKIDLMLSSPYPLLTGVNLILISSDGDFSRNLAELRRGKWNVVVVIGQTPNLTLPQNADIICNVKEFMEGQRPIYMKVIIMISIILISLFFFDFLLILVYFSK